jgi:hypothetical protein
VEWIGIPGDPADAHGAGLSATPGFLPAGTRVGWWRADRTPAAFIVGANAEKGAAMTTEPRGGLRWPRRTRRPGGRDRVAALLLSAVAPVALVEVLTLLRFPPGRVGTPATAALLILTPALLAGTAFAAVSGVRGVRRLIADRRGRAHPQPTNPPIERVAADLRRLLWQHDLVVRCQDVAAPAKRVWALETAITRRATQAARALEVPYPDPPAYRGLDRPQLHRLLRALADQGLVLPATVGLMVRDSGR